MLKLARRLMMKCSAMVGNGHHNKYMFFYSFPFVLVQVLVPSIHVLVASHVNEHALVNSNFKMYKYMLL